MSDKNQTYKYGLVGNVLKFSNVKEIAESIKGVVSAELDGEFLNVELEHTASEYDVFSALYAAAEQLGVEVDYVDEEPSNQSQQSEKDESDEEAVENAEVKTEDETEKHKSKKQTNVLPEEEKKWNKKYIANLVELALSAVLMLVVLCFDISSNTESFLCLIAFAAVGYEIIWEAVMAVYKKKFFNPSIVMVIVIVASMFLTEYLQVAFIAWLFEAQFVLGKILTDIRWERVKSRLYFDFVQVNDGEDEAVFAKDFPLQSAVNLKGGVIPFDGKVVGGCGTVDYYNVTGIHKAESLKESDVVYGGGVLTEGEIDLRVERSPKDSLAGKMYLNMIESAPTALKRKMDKYALYYIPACLAVSLFICFACPALFTKGMTYGDALPGWCYAGVVTFGILNVLAFNAAYELNYKSALYRALTLGSFINSHEKLDELAECDTVIFNEPGSIEQGYSVDKIVAFPGYKGRVLEVLKEFRLKPADLLKDNAIALDEGGRKFVSGRSDQLERMGITVKRSSLSGIVKYITVNGEAVGAVSFKQELKPTAYGAVRELKDVGVRSVVLTEGAEDVYAEISELAEIKGLTAESEEKQSKNPVFVGTELKETASILFADSRDTLGCGCGVLQPNGDLKSVAKIIKLAKRTGKIARFNALFAVVVKAAAVALGLYLTFGLGVGGMWIAVTIDAVATALCLVNSARNGMEVA